jgi:hypothetical protein
MTRKKQPELYEQLWVLFDERAEHDTADAAVLCTAHSRDEAIRDRTTMFPSAVIIRYDVDTDGISLINPTREQP